MCSRRVGSFPSVTFVLKCGATAHYRAPAAAYSVKSARVVAAPLQVASNADEQVCLVSSSLGLVRIVLVSGARVFGLCYSLSGNVLAYFVLSDGYGL